MLPVVAFLTQRNKVAAVQAKFRVLVVMFDVVDDLGRGSPAVPGTMPAAVAVPPEDGGTLALPPGRCEKFGFSHGGSSLNGF